MNQQIGLLRHADDSADFKVGVAAALMLGHECTAAVSPARGVVLTDLQSFV